MTETRRSWSRGAGASALAVVSATLLGLLLFAVAVRRCVPTPLDGPIGDGGPTGRQRAWFTTEGFYPPELDIASGLQFSWTGATAALVIPHLDRSRGYQLTLELAAGRPATVAPPPEVRFAVDGAASGLLQSANVPRSVTLDIPPRRGDTQTVISINVANKLPPPASVEHLRRRFGKNPVRW